MLDFLGTVVWAGVVVYGIWRFAPVLEKFVPAAPVVASDLTRDDIVVPDDLLAFAASLQDPWAIEDTIKVMRERYVDLRDWNRVRSAMGIGALPNQNNP
jgi:hypothetical protein